MAAIGARPVLYHHHPAPVAGDVNASFSSMSSYFSHGGSSTSTSSAASSFSAALGAPAPPLVADPSAAQFDISEYLFDDAAQQGVFAAPHAAADAPPPPPPADSSSHGGAGASAAARSAAEALPERPRTERIAFRTRSEIEILDDGYKWRKYGKKSVKNSPNPRNYYRCSTEGCNVKKRVERDKDDPSYVVTTYEGTHNHVSPSTVYYASQDAASGRFFVAGTQPPGSLN
ncbi:EcWRKY-50, partial [Eragrostis curvula]